jgi:hypothetical protein
MWRIDVNTGVVSYPTTKKRYAPEHNSLSKRSGKRNTLFWALDFKMPKADVDFLFRCEGNYVP